MNASDQINEIGAALAKAQLGIVGAAKDSTNPHFKSAYADLQSVWLSCHTQLNENAIAVVQQTRITESGAVVLVTKLVHGSGQWMSSEYPVAPVQNTPQGMGSALTYARRYSLMCMAGVAGKDDDDGNAATIPGNFVQLPREAPREASKVAPKSVLDLPPVPDVVSVIPKQLCKGPFAILETFDGVKLDKMSIEDLELVISTVHDNRERVKSDLAKSWLLAIEASATTELRDKQMDTMMAPEATR